MSQLDRRHFLKTAGALGAASLAAESVPSVVKADDTPLSSLGKTPKTKFAVNVEMWWRKLPFLERVEQAANFGYPAIEFWPWRNKDIDALVDLTKQRNLDIAQFTAWGFRPGLNETKNHSHFVKEITESCKIAHKLNCKKMTVVGGNDVEGMTQEEMHDNIIKGLKLAAPIAEDNDVMLILEPMNIRVDHKGHCLYGSAPSIRICNEVNSSHVKLNWDLYHMHITEGDLCGHMKEGFDAGQIGYLQLADHPGRNEPGTGEIHYNRVLKEAWDLGYRDYVGLECRPQSDEVTAAKRVAAANIW